MTGNDLWSERMRIVDAVLAPFMDVTLGQVFDQVVEAYPNNLAFIFEDRRVSYLDFARAIDQAERGLWRLGVRKDEHVALVMPNSPEWMAVFVAAARLGAVSVPVNIRLDRAGLEHVLRQSDATSVFIDDRFGDYPMLSAFLAVCRGLKGHARLECAALPRLRRAVVLGGARSPWASSWDEFTAQREGADDADVRTARSRVRPDDVLVIQYTSGTTSFPKGVMNTHAQIVHNAKKFATHMDITPRDRHATAMPFFHNAGLVAGALCAMVNGACLVLANRFRAEAMLEMLDRHRCTSISALDTMYIMMMGSEAFSRYELSGIRTGITTGVEIVRKIAQRMRIPGMLGLYGITEASPNVCLQFPEQPLEYRAVYAGRPHRGVEICIKHPDTGARLAPGERGEICLRGFSVTPGYYNKPQDTASAFDTEGWFHTGDLGRLTAEGDLRFEGRFKDMIRVGGENVAAIEIEDCLLTHPSVKQAHAVPAPHPTLIEVPAAYVVLAPGTATTVDELVTYVAGRLPRYKVPRLLKLVQEAELPMTANGKVQKSKLRERVTEDFGVKASHDAGQQ